MTSVRLSLLATLTAALCLLLTPGWAAAQLGLNCTISASPVTFPTYNVFASTPLDAAGSVSFQCTAGVLVRIELGRGNSSSFEPRTMRRLGEDLAYNLYLDSNRSTIWGDGTGNTQVYTAVATVLVPTTVPIYARVPAAQDVHAGSYDDQVITTIIF